MHHMEGNGADVIKIILGAPEMPSLEDMMRPGMHGHLDRDEIDKDDLLEKTVGFMKEYCGGDDCVDWKSVAKQLMQAISLIDTHTDGVEDGSERADAAIAAIDNETSRLLWGKQDEDNPMSMYQNASYLDKVANGFMMENPADLFNKSAFGKMKLEDDDMDDDEREEKKPDEKPEKYEDKGFDDDDDDDDDEDMKDMKKEKAKLGRRPNNMFGKFDDDDDDDMKGMKKEKAKRKGDPKLGGRPNNMFGKFDDDDDDDHDNKKKKGGKDVFHGLR